MQFSPHITRFAVILTLILSQYRDGTGLTSGNDGPIAFIRQNDEPTITARFAYGRAGHDL